MSSVIVDMGMSLDGYIAGPNGGPQNPLGVGTRSVMGVIVRASMRKAQPICVGVSLA